jgi:hypothetical protein
MDDKTRLGALAESRVTAELLRNRWWVFASTSGKAPFDLVAARGAQLLRVEVKGCATRQRSGGFAVSLRSVRPNRSGNVVRFLTPETSDVVAIYLEPIDTVCFVPTVELAGRTTLTLFEAAAGSRARRRSVRDYATLPSGTVAEWTKATTLKVVDSQGSVGSNPTRSALRCVSEDGPCGSTLTPFKEWWPSPVEGASLLRM